MSRESLLQQVAWQRRFQSYFDPTQALWSVHGLLDGLSQETDPVAGEAVDLAASLLRQALAFNPFDPGVQALARQLAPMSNQSQDFMAWLSAIPEQTDPLTLGQAHAVLEQAGDDPGGMEHILESTGSLLVMFLGVTKFWQWGEKQRCLRWGKRLLKRPDGLPAAPLLAWAAWKSGDGDLAERFLRKAPVTFLGLNLQAETALGRGRPEEARLYWLKSLVWEPDQPHLRYRLWELDQPAPDASEVNRRRIHIGLYTFNKLETTLRTLKSILTSHIGPAQTTRITLINNGSTAFSRQDLDNAVTAAAQGRSINVLHLPVNIGAPAARNWLLRLPETRQAEYMAFLDDDVLVPKNWMACYLQDFKAFPKAVVVGPKGVNPGGLPTIQYVHRFFQETGRRKIRFTGNAPLFMDLGQFDYRRPCLSVMGCCHLFDLRKWERLGIPDFDVRFSPSQVDDLEHDIQIWKAGGQAVYDGRVEVVHLQDAGRQAPLSQASWAHVWGNHMKMEHKFTARELADIDRESREADQAFWQDTVIGV